VSDARPIDFEARERARRDHETSLVVVAGAGTGKTTLLVDRIERLVTDGRATLPEIVAVTFTENAATTIKLRLRQRLERTRGDSERTPEERARVSAALETLEIAPIATIHSLAASLLAERPLECGVVPGFQVADETKTDLLFAEVWDDWLAERLAVGDPVLMDALERGIPLQGEGLFASRSSLRGLARRLIEHRDLDPLVGEEAVDLVVWREEVLARTAPLASLVERVAEGDLLAARLRELGAFAESLRFLSGDALRERLLAFPSLRSGLGQKRNWDAAALEEGRGVAEWARDVPIRLRAALGSALHTRLVRALSDVVERYEAEKNARGLLDFLDLLLKTRNALRDRESVRRYFRERFRHVIVDEFQDTDPLQLEIVDLLTAGRPGALFVVGDAKQSIYRFRRADVALLDGLARRAEKGPRSAVLHLTQSFRARPALLRFVNRVFARLIEPSEEAAQTAYEPIAPPPGLADEPSVMAMRFPAPALEGADLLACEAQALTGLLQRAAGGHFIVRDLATGTERSSRAGDVMVLVRRLTKIRALEEALEAAGLRFVVEGGKSFFDRQEVHEVLAVMRAVDDPRDRVSLVAALRSTFLAVSDRDLVAYALSGGRLAIDADDPERPGGDSVAPALALLRALNAMRTAVSVPRLIETLFDETRILAALTGSRRGEAQIANLEKVVALARDASDLGVLTLRGFVQLLARRVDEGAEEPDLPATPAGDPDVVRILTIHRAKGLEAPIVALHDLDDGFYSPMDVIALRSLGQVAIGFREGCQPPGWAELAKREKARASAEGRRLLYVACTRARDLLVVPRPTGDPRIGDFWRDLVAEVPTTATEDVRVEETSDLVDAEPLEREPRERAGRILDERDAAGDRWEQGRRARVEAGGERALAPVSVTRFAALTAPPAVEHPRTSEARAFGALVHRMLELLPLHGTAKEAPSAMAQALAAEHGLGQAAARRAATVVRRTLSHALLDRARRAVSHRELKVWLPEEDRLLEGVVDLVFEEEGALVVVDYKTESITEAQAIDQAAHHAPQIRLYGRALSLATGLSVRERFVLFTAIGRAVPV